MRILLRLLSPLLGLAVAALGGLVALEAAWTWARPDDDPLIVDWRDLRTDLAEHDWSETPVIVWSSVAIGVGLLLLLLATLARRHDILFTDPAPEVTVVTTPRSLARVVGTRMRATDGVRSASVTASARRIRIRVSSGLYGEEQLKPVLTERMTALLRTIPLSHEPKVHIVVNSPKDRP